MKHLAVIALLCITTFAQETKVMLKPNGEIRSLNSHKPYSTDKSNQQLKSRNLITGVDTLSYKFTGHNFNTTFGFWGDDVILQWFEIPTEMKIKSIGFSCVDEPDIINSQVSISLKLIKMNWNAEQFRSIDNATEFLGYYPSENDGENNIAPFPNEATGEWIDKTEGEYPTPPWAEEDYDLWSNNGSGFEIIPEEQEQAGNYQWVQTNELGFEPEVARGDIIAVVATHNGTRSEGDRIGFYTYDISTTDVTTFPAMKFYEYDLEYREAGWWVREFTFDFALGVELIDIPYIKFSDITSLGSSFSTEPKEVSANIYYGENTTDGIEAFLNYTKNGGNVEKLKMTNDGESFKGILPEGSGGDKFEYWITASAPQVYPSESIHYSFQILYTHPPAPNLIIFNGTNDVVGFTEEYYFRNYPDFNYDAWAYGEATLDILNNYQCVYEICISDPEYDNRQVVKQWLDLDPDRNYFLCGDQWLGAFNNNKDSSFQQGDFEYDVLGIKQSYNDVSYNGSSGQELTSALFPVGGSILTDDLYQYLQNSNLDSVQYDPNSQLGTENWIDAYDVLYENEVQMYVKTRGINNQSLVELKPTLIARKYNSNNKFVIAGFDPLALYTEEVSSWIGDSILAPQYQAMFWFNGITKVNDEKSINNNFHLSQNYPNPFNPTTRIKYQVASIEVISLKVYDILGREVITLINKPMQPGEYDVTFDGSDLPSGVYFYGITAGDFIKTRKMLLIK